MLGTYEIGHQRRLQMNKVARDSRAAAHIRPRHDGQIAQKHAVRMQCRVRLFRVHGHMLLGELVATRDRTHSLHPGRLDVGQGAGALQELGRGRLGKDVAMGARVDDDECGEAGDKQEESGQDPGTAADRAARFTFELGRFVLGVLMKSKDGL